MESADNERRPVIPVLARTWFVPSTCDEALLIIHRTEDHKHQQDISFTDLVRKL
jgi:hypothetical protein